MNKTIAATLLIMGLAASCAKSVEQENQNPSEIVLSLGSDSIDMDVQTKASATEISSMPASLYLAMTTGTAGSSEASKLASVSKGVSAGKLATGIYQTESPTSYNYYLSNLPITVTGTGSTIAAVNTTDVIAGTCTSNSATPAVTLDHVFARTGTFNLNAQKGYEISDISWKIKSESGSGTKGTYNMATKQWSSVSALAEQSVASGTDLYLVPGNYTLSVTYTLKKEDWTKTITKTASVKLEAGKINNISGTAVGGTAEEITLSVTLTAWTNNNITVTFS